MAAGVTVVRMAQVVTAVAVAVVLLGGSAAWLAERSAPRSTINSWGDGLWWALTTLTTVGYGDQVPVTLAGRLIAAAVMVTGVAVLGGVAAGVALIVARSVAAIEEKALEVEAESIEQRVESRLDRLDARLARIEEQLQRSASRAGEVAQGDASPAAEPTELFLVPRGDPAEDGRADDAPVRRRAVEPEVSSPTGRSQQGPGHHERGDREHEVGEPAAQPVRGQPGGQRGAER